MKIVTGKILILGVDGAAASQRHNFDCCWGNWVERVSLAMNLTRPIMFWIATCAAVIAVVVLLREILLPFVAGLVLAYLFNPLANRLERLGLNRLLAALVIIGVFIVGFVVLISLTAPIIARELAYLLDNVPLYFGQLKTLTSDPDRPWLRKIVGEGLVSAEQSMGELATLGADWFGSLVRSVWTGVRELISVFSLAIVTPVVAGYHLRLEPHARAVDNWTPPPRADRARRSPARSTRHHRWIRARPGHALPHPVRLLYGGAVAGRPQSQPSDRCGRGRHQLRPLSRLDHRPGGGDKRGNCAILAELVIDRRRADDRRRSGRGRLCTVAPIWSAVASACIRCGMISRAVRIRIHIRVRRAAARGAARGGIPGAPALRVGAILCNPLYRSTGRGRANRGSNATFDR
jgi:hypothetical protein